MCVWSITGITIINCSLYKLSSTMQIYLETSSDGNGKWSSFRANGCDSEVVEKFLIQTENSANNLTFCPAEEARNIIAVGGPTNIGIKAFHFNVRNLANYSIIHTPSKLTMTITNRVD